MPRKNIIQYRKTFHFDPKRVAFFSEPDYTSGERQLEVCSMGPSEWFDFEEDHESTFDFVVSNDPHEGHELFRDGQYSWRLRAPDKSTIFYEGMDMWFEKIHSSHPFDIVWYLALEV